MCPGLLKVPFLSAACTTILFLVAPVWDCVAFLESASSPRQVRDGGCSRLALAHKDLKNWSDSEAAIQRGLELDADEARFNLCYHDIQMGLLKDSASNLMKAGQVKCGVHGGRGCNVSLENALTAWHIQPEAAIAALSQALVLPTALKDDIYWILSLRSRLYMSQNDAISAADDATESIKLYQRIVEGYERNCDALVALGDLPAARACAQVRGSIAPTLAAILDCCSISHCFVRCMYV